MNIVDLILTDSKEADVAIAASMQSRVFDFLDNYQLAEEETLDEAKLTTTKDKDGKLVSWKHEGDWKKTDKPMTDAESKEYVKTGAKNAVKITKNLAK